VNALATPSGAEPALRSSTVTDRLVAVLPLASIYVWLCAVYAVEAWQRVTPWLFTDELELTQLSRSIAATGHAARRGQAHSADSLYTYLTAPIWLIDDVAKAYSTLKYFDVFVMTSVVFPTYFLARLVVGKRAALFAAAGAAAIPSLAYSSYIVEETLAYPYAALCLFLIAKAFVVRGRPGGRWWAAAAIGAAIVAPAVRTELVMIPVVLVLVALFGVWSSEWARGRRAAWSTGDWIGAVTLFFGAVFLISAIGSHQSIEWLAVTRLYKHRIIVQGNWAVGSLAIGLGVIPLVAGLVALVRAPGEEPSREVRAFRCVAAAGLLSFGLYTGMKAAYLSTVFATRVEERNFIYVAPLLFVGTALVFERRRVNPIALAVASAYTLYLVGYALYHAVGSAYEMGVQLYSDALGFAILQQANRYLLWTPTFARWLLIGILAGGVLVLLAPRLLAGRERVTAVLFAVTAAAIVGWNLTGEIAAAAGTKSIAQEAGMTLRRPFTWVDSATKLHSTLYLGESEVDQNPEWELEFWNRSIHRVSSLDGSIDGPGPAGGPNLTRNGTLFWGESATDLTPQFDFAVEDRPCIDLAGAVVKIHDYRAGGRKRAWRLIRLTHPNRLRSECTGIYADGWSGANDSAYFRFSGPAGWLRIVYSRRDWGYPSGPSPVHILLGRLVINSNNEPVLGKVAAQLDGTIDSTQTKTAWLYVPSGSFAVHVVVDKKLVPQQFNPSSGDRRELGAQLSYAFLQARPKRHR
jgi:hypothetical protein